MSILEKLIAVIAPFQCLLCQQEGALICDWCWPDAITTVPSRCYRCYRLTVDFAVCDKCKKHTPLRHVFVVTTYDGIGKELVKAMKYRQQPAASQLIAQFMTENTPVFDPSSVCSYVPTAHKRVRERGFDHAKHISLHFSGSKQLHQGQLLERIGSKRQVGTPKVIRKQQVDGQYKIHSKANKIDKSKTIILIDDVMTTGATLEEVARVLKKYGFKKVYGLVFAQKM